MSPMMLALCKYRAKTCLIVWEHLLQETQLQPNCKDDPIADLFFINLMIQNYWMMFRQWLLAAE